MWEPPELQFPTALASKPYKSQPHKLCQTCNSRGQNTGKEGTLGITHFLQGITSTKNYCLTAQPSTFSISSASNPLKTIQRSKHKQQANSPSGDIHELLCTYAKQNCYPVIQRQNLFKLLMPWESIKSFTIPHHIKKKICKINLYAKHSVKKKTFLRKSFCTVNHIPKRL